MIRLICYLSCITVLGLIGQPALSQQITFTRTAMPGPTINSQAGSTAQAHVAYPIDASEHDSHSDPQSDNRVTTSSVNLVSAWDTIPGTLFWATASASAYSLKSEIEIDMGESDVDPEDATQISWNDLELDAEVLSDGFELPFAFASAQAYGDSDYFYNLETDVGVGEQALVQVDFFLAANIEGAISSYSAGDEVEIFRQVGASFVKAVFDGEGWDLSWKLKDDTEFGSGGYDEDTERIEGRELNSTWKKAFILMEQGDDLDVSVSSKYKINVGASHLFGLPHQDDSKFRFTNAGRFTGGIIE